MSIGILVRWLLPMCCSGILHDHLLHKPSLLGLLELGGVFQSMKHETPRNSSQGPGAQWNDSPGASSVPAQQQWVQICALSHCRHNQTYNGIQVCATQVTQPQSPLRRQCCYWTCWCCPTVLPTAGHGCVQRALQGHTLCGAGWPLRSHSALVLQQPFAPALLGTIFLLFFPRPRSHRSFERAEAARSLVMAGTAARLGLRRGHGASRMRKGWSWHYLPPLTVHNAQ